MRLQVSLTERGLTLQAGLQGLELNPSADVTDHFSSLSRGLFSVFDSDPVNIIYNISECCVDIELWSCVECPLTHWTLAQVSCIPVSTDTDLAEVVSTWSGDRLSEHIQTDRALELLFRQETARGRHFWNTIKQLLKYFLE